MISAILICALLALQSYTAQGQSNTKEGVPVEVVATASEYVPRSTTVSNPGHSYTSCLGTTSYFGRFSGYGDSGSLSGTAETNTNCATTFSPPSESTFTTYSRVNYTIVRNEQALYLLSCTQTWKPSGKQRAARVLAGVLAGGAGRLATQNSAQTGGTWTECPAFGIGTKHTLVVNNTSDARLDRPAGGNPTKLEYLSSAVLPVSNTSPTPQAQSNRTPKEARVHITSSPAGGEIYIDGKFFGNTPSDITLEVGEHVLRIVTSGKEWSRSIQITTGEVSVHAEIPEK